jgi:hypothetical protein
VSKTEIGARTVEWLGCKDLNLDKQSQSLLCYRYTTPQCIFLVRLLSVGRQSPLSYLWTIPNP